LVASHDGHCGTDEQQADTWRLSGGHGRGDEIDGDGADGLPRHLGRGAYQGAQFGDDGSDHHDDRGSEQAAARSSQAVA